MVTTYTVGTGKNYATIHAAIAVIPANLVGTGIHVVEVYAGGTTVGNGHFYNGAVEAFVGKTGFSGSDHIEIIGMVPNLGERGRGIIVYVNDTNPVLYGVHLGVYCKINNVSVTESAPDKISVAGIYFDEEAA